MNELGVIILILLAILAAIFIMPIVAIAKASRATREAERAHERIRQLESTAADHQRMLRDLEKRLTGAPETSPIPEPKPLKVESEEVPQPPPLPAWETEAKSPIEEAPEVPQWETREEPVPAGPVSPPKPPFSIEQFLGVKMFAWLGGVAVFFGVIFFVKYAFEHNLIPPALRVAMGFVAGIGFLTAGMWTHRREKYRVLAQAMCATGVLILYGVSFAAHAVYRFPLFNSGVTFALMSLITVTAFLSAVRLNALVIAVLGMLGGFITPVLLPTVHDHAFALFSYIALLDAGLLAVTWRGRWSFLASAAAVGTVLMEIGWVARHFVDGRYFEGPATLVPMGIFLFFCLLFLAAAWRMKSPREDDLHRSGAACGLLAAAMGLAFYFLEFQAITGRTFLLYGYVMLLNLTAIALAWLRPRFNFAQTAVAGVTFLHLVLWTSNDLRPGMLGSALTVYLVFGALHALWPAIRERLRPGETSGTMRLTGMWMAPLIVALMALPVFVLPQVSFILWPAVLVANLLAIGIALAGGAVRPVLASLVVTLLVAAAWLFHVPAETASLPPILMVVVFFALLFSAAGWWLGKRQVGDSQSAKLLPAASACMPFALLILMVLQLPIANPTPVFGAGLLLVILLLGLTIIARQTVLALVAVLCCLALEGVWHANRFDADNPGIALGWYVGFYVLFTLFPFVHRKLRVNHTEPWVASSIGGVGHFILIHDLVRHAWPNSMMGLLPAAFAVPSIVSLIMVLRSSPTMDRPTQVRLSWLGGVALLFITLIFPIQFDRQWLTVSWALEGACLVWLFRRVPHHGLLWTGLALLAVSFVRLTINPAVFSAYPRSGNAIFNWHLYTYGIVAAAHFLAAWWLPVARRRFQNLDLTAILWSMGGLLLFLLLNIEIADFFTAPGQRFIAFEFAGNFARDMTYTIAWGLFALALLVIGIWRRAKGVRLAAIGLLATTLLKLFLHDLANIENVFRIAALVATGVIAFIASFLYQRFFANSSET
jgi:uncharacterized membrane protein